MSILDTKDDSRIINEPEDISYKPKLRQDIVYLDKEQRRTSNYMTKFEYTEIIANRAKQIQQGGPVFTDIGNITDTIEIAKKELYDRKCPLCVERMLNDYIGEIWSANELILPM